MLSKDILLKLMAYFAPVSRFNALTKLEPRNKWRDLLAVQDMLELPAGVIETDIALKLDP